MVRGFNFDIKHGIFLESNVKTKNLFQKRGNRESI
jgi:hypothetical protein